MKMSQSSPNKKMLLEDFDYKKIKEELDFIIQDLQKVSEELTNMKVECVMANMELACTVDAIDFDSRVKEIEEMMKVFGMKEDMVPSEDITKAEPKEHDTNS